MPSWLVDTFVVMNTLLLLINLVLLLLILSYIEQREREKDEKGGGREDLNSHEKHLAARIKFEKKLNLEREKIRGGGKARRTGSWYTHLENKHRERKR